MALISLLAAVAVVVAAYTAGDRLPGARLLAVVRRTGWARRHPGAGVDAAARTAGGALVLAVAATGLCLAVPGAADRLVSPGVSPLVVLLGVPLGVAVAGVSTLMCLVVPEAIRALAHEPGLATSAGGRARQVRLAMGVLPRTPTAGVLGGHAVAEEVLLRGVLVTLALPFGTVTAFALPLAVALVVELGPGTTWQTVLYPVLGTVVTATVHGLLFLQVADLRPLVLAHLTHLALTLTSPSR